MLDELGFPLSGHHRCQKRDRVGTARQRRQHDRDRADGELIRRTATWLREAPGRAGLSWDEDAHALAALLDVLAAEIAHLDSGVRWQVLESCRAALRETMASPAIRRTRRR